MAWSFRKGRGGHRIMGECRAVLRVLRHCRRVLLQISDRAPHVLNEKLSHVAAESVAHEHTHYDDVGDVCRHRVGGRLPATHAQSVREVEERIAWLTAVLDHPRDRRNAFLAVAIESQLKRSELADLLADVACGVVPALNDLPVTRSPQAQEQVVLRNDLSGGAGEVQRESRHVAGLDS